VVGEKSQSETGGIRSSQMPENAEMKLTLFLSVLALFMAFITAKELSETANKCVLRPK